MTPKEKAIIAAIERLFEVQCFQNTALEKLAKAGQTPDTQKLVADCISQARQALERLGRSVEHLKLP